MTHVDSSRRRFRGRTADVPARRRGVSNLRLRAKGDVATYRPIPKLTATGVQAKPVRLGMLTGAPAKVIRARVGKVHVVLIVDDSGSMYARITDLSGRRYAAAQSFVNLQRTAGEGKLWVIHWGHTVPDSLVAGPLEVKRDRKAIKAALAAPPTLGGNDLPLALRKARAVTKPEPEDDSFIYIVLSDGVEAVTDETRAAISALPADSVHLVLVDVAGWCAPAMEAAWRTAGFASVNRLKTFDTRVMGTQVAQIYAEALGLELDTDTTED